MAAPPPPRHAVTAPVGPTTQAEAWWWLFAACAGYAVGALLSSGFEQAAATIDGARGGAAALSAMASPPVWFVACGFAGLWIGFGGAGLAVARTGRRLGVAFAHSDVRFVLLGFALQGVLTVAYLGESKALNHPENTLLGAGSGGLIVITTLLVVVGAPFFEEVFFRGVLLRGLLGAVAAWPRALGVGVAVGVDALIFAALHLGTDSWIELPGLFLVGVVLAALAIKTKRLGPSMVTHASFNVLAVWIFYGAIR